MGIRTARVDALTFGLGSGIAGIAGVALSQIDNVSPNLGQSYIIDSFMVVVFGGVGNLWGTLVGACTLGIANKFLEPCRGRRARQDPDPGPHHPVHPEAAARPVRPQGPGGGSMTAAHPDRVAGPRALTTFIAVVAACGMLDAAARTCCCRGLGRSRCRPIWSRSGASMSATRILALSIDLVWGYCGILSLGHGAFFALGGYAMGMYLMRQIGTRGVYGNPILPDFMVFLNWTELPWYWYGFDMFWFAALMVLLVPGLLAFVLRLARLPHAASPASICRSSPRR